MIRKYLQIGTSCFFIVSCSTAQKEITTIKEKPVPTEAVKQAEPTVSKSINTSYLDLNIRPQDDFFLFSNGKWVKENPVPPSESRWGSFNELDKSNKQKLTEILKFAVANSSKKGSQNQLLGDFYTSYTSMSKRNELGITPIQADLDKIKNIKSRQEIVSIIAESHKVGVSMFFSFGVGQDLKNVAKNISSIDQDGIGLPNCDYYLQADKATILDAYQKHIAASFMLLNYDEKAANEIAKSVVAFEKNLALSMMKPSELRVPENTYNLKSKKELDKAFGKFDFESYLAAVGSQSFDSIVVGQPKFIEKIASLLETAEMFQLKNYLLWSTVNAYAGLLTEEFVNLNFKFYGGVLSGKKEMKSLNDRAIDEITGLEIGELLGKAFVEKHFSQKSQDRVNSMVDNLLLVFKDRINNLEWMSKETKEQALVKLNSIGRKLGFPSKWEDFSALNINASTYLENMREMSRASHKKNLSELYKPIDKEKWGMPAHMVNAYYNPLLNEIAFPAGIMQAPFFDENDLKLFEEKTALLGKTFSNFCPIDGHCVNPDLTMGENIADLGGLTLAYYAYTLTEEFKSGNLIDGYTPAQRFFIGYAQLWKINYTDAEMKNRIANDPHSPGMYRVNGPLMNCPEFFAAFDVKEGDKMRNSLLKLAKIW